VRDQFIFFYKVAVVAYEDGQELEGLGSEWDRLSFLEK
jgi:hypothetical protein